eukprot:gene1153-8798_t
MRLQSMKEKRDGSAFDYTRWYDTTVDWTNADLNESGITDTVATSTSLHISAAAAPEAPLVVLHDRHPPYMGPTNKSTRIANGNTPTNPTALNACDYCTVDWAGYRQRTSICHMESQELSALLADSTRTIEAYTAVLATQYEATPVTAGDEHAMPPATPVALLDVAKLQRHQAALYIID